MTGHPSPEQPRWLNDQQALDTQRWLEPLIKPTPPLRPQSIGLHILTPPETPGARSALQFAQIACQMGHRLALIFFNGPGVQNLSTANTPSGEATTTYVPTGQATDSIEHDPWALLARKADLPLLVCSGSAQSYGVTNTLPKPPWTAASLSDLLDAYQTLDHVITFKPPTSSAIS